MDAVQHVSRRTWADGVAIVAGVIAIGLGIYGAPLVSGDKAQHTDYAWVTYPAAGVLAILAVVLAHRARGAGRALCALGGLLLLASVALLRPTDATAWLTRIVPALAMLAAAPFLGPMPAPEEEGR